MFRTKETGHLPEIDTQLKFASGGKRDIRREQDCITGEKRVRD